MDRLVDALFELTSDIRYVAVYKHGELSLRQRPNLTLAPASELDRYEELLVNPTLLTLARQRGDIDCGGVDYIVVRYGHFFQFVVPVNGGHVSVAFEPDTDPVDHASEVVRVIGAYIE